MIASLQKRRNQSSESPYENKFYLKRQHGNSAILGYSPTSAMKDRLPNRSLVYSLYDSEPHRHRTTS